jgi:hypothetical protein
MRLARILGVTAAALLAVCGTVTVGGTASAAAPQVGTNCNPVVPTNSEPATQNGVMKSVTGGWWSLYVAPYSTCSTQGIIEEDTYVTVVCQTTNLSDNLWYWVVSPAGWTSANNVSLKSGTTVKSCTFS